MSVAGGKKIMGVIAGIYKIQIKRKTIKKKILKIRCAIITKLLFSSIRARKKFTIAKISPTNCHCQMNGRWY